MLSKNCFSAARSWDADCLLDPVEEPMALPRFEPDGPASKASNAKDANKRLMRPEALPKAAKC
jgi:hypothetical protein